MRPLKIAPLPLLLLLACSSEPAGSGPPERLENPSAAVDERAMTAVIDGPIAEVRIPVAKRGAAALSGAVEAELLDFTSVVDEVVLSSARASFRQDQDTAEYALRLAGVPPGMARADAAGLVIRWRVETPTGVLHGRRSLYAALGTFEVQIRGATDLVDTAPVTVVVRDEAAEPVVGAEVSVVAPQEQGEALARGVTDDRGEASLDVGLPDGRDHSDIRVTVRHDGTEAWTTATLRRVRDERIHLGLDKTIYKPGQTLHLRAVALRHRDRHPLAEREVRVEAIDGKGNKVFRTTVQTDPLGVVAVDIPTDTRVNEGDWRLSATMGQTRAELSVPVRRYNLPKLRVDVTTEQAFLQPGETLRGMVQASYLFGMPVLDGSVRVAAELDGATLAEVEGRTDDEGAYAFALTVDAARVGTLLEPESLSIVATVTDPAEQTEVGGAGLPLVSVPLVVRVFPEVGRLVRGVDNRVHVLISDPLGRPVVADVDVTGAVTGAGLTTDRDGVVSFDVFGGEHATVGLSLAVRDGAERTVDRDVSLEVQDGLLVRTDRAVYGRGDRISVEVFAPAGVHQVYADVFQGTVGRVRRAALVEGGRARFEIEVDEKLQGGLLVDAFALGEAGEVLSGRRRLFARGDDQLTVQIDPSAETYGPGDDATVTVRALDAAGRPKVAAVGLYAVDEAVFALGGEPADDLRTFFSLDPHLLPAGTTALGRTVRDLAQLEPGEESDRIARLLFAAAGEAGGPGFSFNSVQVERPLVRGIVLSRVRAQLSDLMARLADSAPSADQVERLIGRRARQLVDPFGQRYVVALDPSPEVVELTSWGPDERAGTFDDITTRQYYGWIKGWQERSPSAGSADAGPGFPQNDNRSPAPPPALDDDLTAGPEEGAGEGVRSDFRETVYANARLVTDASGQATVSFPLADSITTWRLSADAHTADGRLGSARRAVRTFQDFFVDVTLPQRLTVDDELEVPAVVYNYLGTSQDVQVSLPNAPWFTVLSGATQTVRLGPSEVRAVRFRIRVDEAGRRALRIDGAAGSLTDALVRTVDVIPNGTPEVESVSDRVHGRAQHTITIPADALPGGTRVFLSLTPGFAAEAVQGMEGLIKEPNGCFEQTTAVAWPNTLVTVYLETTGQMTDEKRQQILPVVQRGYQRLLTFESPTGGVNWWGDEDPGNRILSAIMLWHLKDLEGLIEIDEAVKARTLDWLLARQREDGRWVSGDALHAGNETLGTSDARTTAFIAWALAHTGWADAAVDRATAWLGRNLPGTDDLYANALSLNAMAFGAPSSAVTGTLLTRIDGLKATSPEGLVSWPSATPSWTGASGDAAAIETTGLVMYGLLRSEAYLEAVAGATRYLANSKDALGSWYNTQATMNALRALLAAASPSGSEADGTATIEVNGVRLDPIAVSPETGDLHRTFEFTEHVGTGDNQVTVALTGEGELSYTLTRQVYRPRAAPQQNDQLRLDVSYDETELPVGGRVRASVTAVYTGEGRRDQVLVRVGRAPGFSPDTGQLDALVADGRAARYEIDAEFVTLYLMNLEGGRARDLSFDFVAGLAVTADAPASEMYVYYEPTIRTEAAPVRFTVQAP